MNTRRLVALTATLLLLTGCGADAEPKFEADPTSSASPPSPTPDEPEPWEEKTPDGAIAFVKLWVEEFSSAFMSGDTTRVRELATDSCDTCSGFVDLIDDAYRDGGFIRGAAWRVRKARPSGSPPAGQAAISADIFQPAQVVRRGVGQPLRTDAGEVTYLFALRWENGWRLAGLTFEGES